MEDNEQEEASGGGSGSPGADLVAEGCSVAPGLGEEDKTHVCYYNYSDSCTTAACMHACMDKQSVLSLQHN